jgi:uncharacterized caspase-like protein
MSSSTTTNNMNNKSPETQSSSGGGILDKTRQFIHEKVKTPELREEERQQNMTFTDKIAESLPDSPSQAVDMARDSFHAAVEDVKKNFNDRLEEGKQDDNRIQHNTDSADQKEKKSSFQPIKGLREKIYDATKSEEERKAEEKAALGVLGQIKANTKEINPFLSEEEKKQLP